MSREAAEQVGTQEFLETAPEGRITIDFGMFYTEEGAAKLTAFFKCCSCELRMSWVGDRRLFWCEDCDIVLSPREALVMAQRCEGAVSRLIDRCEEKQIVPVAAEAAVKKKGRSWIWRWLSWFGGQSVSGP
jgi:hypothetical protein